MFAAGDVRSTSVKRVASAVGEDSVVISDVHRYLADHRNSFAVESNSALAAPRSASAAAKPRPVSNLSPKSFEDTLNEMYPATQPQLLHLVPGGNG
jgi:hypothetical protein